MADETTNTLNRITRQLAEFNDAADDVEGSFKSLKSSMLGIKDATDLKGNADDVDQLKDSIDDAVKTMSKHRKAMGISEDQFSSYRTQAEEMQKTLDKARKGTDISDEAFKSLTSSMKVLTDAAKDAHTSNKEQTASLVEDRASELEEIYGENIGKLLADFRETMRQRYTRDDEGGGLGNLLAGAFPDLSPIMEKIGENTFFQAFRLPAVQFAMQKKQQVREWWMKRRQLKWEQRKIRGVADEKNFTGLEDMMLGVMGKKGWIGEKLGFLPGLAETFDDVRKMQRDASEVGGEVGSSEFSSDEAKAVRAQIEAEKEAAQKEVEDAKKSRDLQQRMMDETLDKLGDAAKKYEKSLGRESEISAEMGKDLATQNTIVDAAKDHLRDQQGILEKMVFSGEDEDTLAVQRLILETAQEQLLLARDDLSVERSLHQERIDEERQYRRTLESNHQAQLAQENEINENLIAQKEVTTKLEEGLEGKLGDIENTLEQKFNDITENGIPESLDLSNSSDVKSLSKDIGLSGSPPYLESILNALTGRQSVLQGAAGGSGALPEVPEGYGKGLGELGKNIQILGKGIGSGFEKMMLSIGNGIKGLFMAIGSIPLPMLGIGAAAIGVIAAGLVGLGFALKTVAPFVEKVFGGLAKVIVSIGEVLAKVITTVADSFIKLTSIPLKGYINMSLGLLALAPALLAFGQAALFSLPGLAIFSAFALTFGVMTKLVGGGEGLLMMGDGFFYLAEAVRDFAKASLGLLWTIPIFAVLGSLPIVGKMIDLAKLKAKEQKGQGVETLRAETLQVEGMQGLSLPTETVVNGQNSIMENQVGGSGQVTVAAPTQVNNMVDSSVTQNIGLKKTARDENFWQSVSNVSVAFTPQL